MKNRDNTHLLFVNACLRRNAPTKLLPVGLAYVMTYVAEQGYTFDLLDIDINEYDNDWVETYVREHSYDVVLLGTIVTHYKWVKWFVAMVKRHHPETRVVVGNSVGGSLPEIFLKKAPADVAVIGEGEITTFEVLECWRVGGDLGSVEGIAFLNERGEVVKTPARKALKHIDEFPMIQWDFFDVDRYVKKSAHYLSMGLGEDKNATTVAMPVSTARGCAFKCTFCHYVYWNDPYRHRSSESIMEEIRRNIDKYGANYITLWDDLSFASLTQVEKFTDAVLQSNLQFSWMAAIRSDLFGNPKIALAKRRDIAAKMKESGCVTTGFSLESGSQKILDMMNKKIEPHYFLEQVRILRDVGITCNTSVVFGYPIETKETIRETFDSCLDAGVYPSMGFLLPLPGTGMYQYAKEKGFITDDDAYLDSITERQDICLNMTAMSDEEIMEEIKAGAQRLNQALGLKLSEDRLLRTGGYKKHTNQAGKTNFPVDIGKPKRIENDVSFNYSGAVFDVVPDQTQKFATKKQ